MGEVDLWFSRKGRRRRGGLSAAEIDGGIGGVHYLSLLVYLVDISGRRTLSPHMGLDDNSLPTGY